MTAPVPAVWFENGPAFEITDPSRATAVATYPATGDVLLSGWLLGGVEAQRQGGDGRRHRWEGARGAYGFRPQYRGQSMATQPLIWGAILRRAARGAS